MTDIAERVEMDNVLPPGTRVEVRKRFDASWASGFEVVDVGGNGYRLRRMSDGMELPADFADEDVRREKKRDNSMWWY
jgi:hypothetical protein